MAAIPYKIIELKPHFFSFELWQWMIKERMISLSFLFLSLPPPTSVSMPLSIHQHIPFTITNSIEKDPTLEKRSGRQTFEKKKRMMIIPLSFISPSLILCIHQPLPCLYNRVLTPLLLMGWKLSLTPSQSHRRQRWESSTSSNRGSLLEYKTTWAPLCPVLQTLRAITDGLGNKSRSINLRWTQQPLVWSLTRPST